MNHKFGFEDCEWINDSENPELERCVKNSDQSHTPQFEDDCIELGGYNLLEGDNYPGTSGLDCLKDTEPPSTEVVLSKEVYNHADLRDGIKVLVQDNVFSSSGITTYFCLARKESNEGCVINKTLPQLTGEGEGEFILYYKSRDDAGNFEPPKHKFITLKDFEYPVLKGVSFESMEE